VIVRLLVFISTIHIGIIE